MEKFFKKYKTLLSDYLITFEEAKLLHAHDFAKNVASGYSIPKIVNVHFDALNEIDLTSEKIRGAQKFLLEVIMGLSVETGLHMEEVLTALYEEAVINFFDEFKHLNSAHCDYCMHETDHTSILLPMRHEEALTGLLHICLEKDRAINEEELGLLREVAGDLAFAREKIKAEESLREKEERLALALEGTRAGLWDWYVQTGKTVYDERWAEIVGYELDQLEPVSIETWKDLTHPGDLERSEELLEKHFAGETDFYDFEGRMKHKNGEWVWIRDRGKVVEWDEEGNPIRMTGTHIDITDRKQKEERIAFLHSWAQKLNRADSMDEIYEYTLDAMEQTLGFTQAAVQRKKENTLHLEAYRGYASLPEEVLQLPLDDPGITVTVAN